MCARPRRETATVAKVTGLAAAAVVGSGEHSAGDCGEDGNRAVHFVSGQVCCRTQPERQ